MSISLDLLPAVTNIGNTDIMHLRSAAGNDFKITGANVLRNLNHDLAANSLGIGILVPTVDIHVFNAAADVAIVIETTLVNGDSTLGFINDTNQWNIRLKGDQGNRFQIRDVTNSLTPFDIEPLAPTNMLYLASGGGVLIHTGTSLHPTLDTIESLGNWSIIGRNVNTDATSKATRIGISHYTNAEEPLLMLMGVVGSATNDVLIGGGNSLGNAATAIQFYTAANTITTTGTERGRFISSGELLLGQTSVDSTGALLQVAGDLSLRGASNQDRTLYFASDASILWDESEDEFYFNKSIKVDDGIETDGIKLKTKVVEIGDWDMDATESVAVAHGIDEQKIRGIQCIIRNDTAANVYPISSNNVFDGTVDGLISAVSSTSVTLGRQTGGIFDSASFDSTSFNRGWIIIQYTI